VAQISSLKTQTKFKKTEIGDIPVDWGIIRMVDVCEAVGGSTPSTRIKEYWDGNIPWAVPTDITKLSGNLISSTERNITEKGLSSISARLLPVGSILLTSRATVGECAINTKPMATNQGFASLICKNNIHNWFIFYLIKFLKKELERLASGSTFKEVSKRSIRAIKIPFPPLPEQKKIAEILLTVDEAIEKKKEVIEKSKEIKKGLMQELITHGIGHKKFQKTNIGQIPEEWEVMRVKDICKKPQYGFTASATNESVGPKFLRITDIQDGNVNWETVPYCKCPDSLIKNYILKSGDILFTRTGATTGKSFMIKNCPKAIFASYLIRITAGERIIPDFLYQVFNSFIYWKQINQQIGGSAQGGVNATSLSLIRIPLPSFAEQKKIAKILHEIDKQINSEIDLLKELSRIKNGLINELLQGKIRVKSER
jgi:type I restriction enzyme S subunit